MDDLSVTNPYEEYLCAKASMTNTPIGGMFELLPYCNMDCKMCFIRLEKNVVNKMGGLLPPDFWINKAMQAQKGGLLFLLISGGEPMLYPNFWELYDKLRNLGLIITINTNGTLIGENEARFFGEHRPRRLNISIYGKDNETYKKLCGNPKGFTQLENAVYWLKKYNVPIKLNCSLTKYNYEQLDEMRTIAERWRVPLDIAYYMMPPNRKIDKVAYNEYRLTPELAAKAAFDIKMYSLPKEQRIQKAQTELKKVENFQETRSMPCGFWCRAANVSFWINWKGEMVPCCVLNEPKIDFKELDFEDAWKIMLESVNKIQLSEKCYLCSKRPICPHCAASEVSETGVFGKEPDYLCSFSEEYLKLLKQEVNDELLF